MEEKVRIDQFLDETGRIVQLPRKQKPKLAVLRYLASKFELGTIYAERDVNGICNRWHTFGDFTTLRRELVDYGLIARERDGSKYWRAQESAVACDAPEATACDEQEADKQ